MPDKKDPFVSIAVVETKLDNTNQRLDKLEKKLETIEAHIRSLSTHLSTLKEAQKSTPLLNNRIAQIQKYAGDVGNKTTLIAQELKNVKTQLEPLRTLPVASINKMSDTVSELSHKMKIVAWFGATLSTISIAVIIAVITTYIK